MVAVTFLHPDLGIGGAERAVVDAALALKSRGHSVHFVTAHHDPNHCFVETKDGTFPAVTAVGDWLPRSIAGRCYALCAYIRMIYAAVYLVYFSDLKCDVIFCDQISACIPILRMGKARILFYCHFPDMLLTQRQSGLKKLYRAPIDWLEEKTTGMAHVVLVNSQFTAGVFKETFSSLQHINPEVLYPIPDFSGFEKPSEEALSDIIPNTTSTVFLSINRYERKKNLGLAIEALGKLKELKGDLKGVHLVMAGGYDERVTENKEHFKELYSLVNKLNLEDEVTFLCSIKDSLKTALLKRADCLIYTPDREHFGIVPVEAMYMKCAVIAVNSGGPLETVSDGQTGFLCPPQSEDFAAAMFKLVEDPKLAENMGESGHRRVTEKFSFTAFTNQLCKIVDKLCDNL